MTVAYQALRARDLPCDPLLGKVVVCGRYQTYQAGAVQRTAVETALEEAKLTAATRLFLQPLEQRIY